jgi:hypothetical protein
MSKHKTYRGFFSYSHHDAETDPGLVKAFTKSLENRVNAKLANARFEIWRDEEGLRTGNKWNEKIEAELRACDVVIVLLTPRWIESEYCRKEYIIVEQIESGRGVGDYVAPILARSIEKQEKHLTPNQRDVYERIKSRQYLKAIVTEFLKLKKSERDSLIDKLADDLEGMVERRRTAQPAPEPSTSCFSVHERLVNLMRGLRTMNELTLSPTAKSFSTNSRTVASVLYLHMPALSSDFTFKVSAVASNLECGERLSRSTIKDLDICPNSLT